MMENINYTYEAKPIDTAVLSVLDVTSDGKIVSAADWTALWNAVLVRINHIDTYCSDISALVINWQESIAAFEKVVTDINALFNTLSDGFIHYGAEAPTDEHIRLWVQPSSEVDDKSLVNKAELIAAITNSEAAVNAITDQKLSVKANKLERIKKLTIAPELPKGVTQFIADSNINEIKYPTTHTSIDGVNKPSWLSLMGPTIPKDSVITVYHRIDPGPPSVGVSHTFYLKTNTHWSNALDGSIEYGHYIFNIRIKDSVVLKGTHQFIEGNTEFPNIPKVSQSFNPNSEDAQSGKAVAEALSGYVVAEVGKGLSSNDFTNEDKEKLYSALQNENVDQTYIPNSENPQSGKAVAEAVATEQNRADNAFANALKGSKSGSAILIDDVSPVTNEMGVKVRGKNLFDKSIPYEDYTSHGGGYRLLSIYVGSGSSVTVSLKQKHDIGLGGYFYCIAYKSGVAGASQEWLYSNSNTGLCVKSVTMISEDGYISLFMTSGAYNSFKDEIMVEIGSTATAYTPYVPDLTAVKVSRCGKNLFDINQARGGDFDTFSIGDNVITATSDNSNNSKAQTVSMRIFDGELPAGDYILRLNAVIENTPKHNRPNEILTYKNGSIIAVTNGMGKDGSYSPKIKFTLSEKAKINISFYKNVNYSQETVSDTVYKVTLSNIQLELGTTVTEYEPYITPTEFTPTADGTVNGVTSLYPNTTLTTDTDGVIINCEYNRDINKAFAALEAAIATNNS